MNKKPTIKIGLVQISCTENTNQNIEKTIAYIKKAKEQGAQIVCLQEVFSEIYFPQDINDASFELAQPIDSPLIQIMSEAAKKNDVCLIVPFFEKDNDSYYNTSVVLNSQGEVAGKYRKNHIPQNNGYQEKYYFKPGNLGFPVFKINDCRFGISICWDHWFTETQRAYGKQGCDIVFSPTALGFCDFSGAHIDKNYQKIWKKMIQGQCIQNGIYMVVVNRTGIEKGIQFWGNSLVCDPKGNIISNLDSDEGVLVVNIDLNIGRNWLSHQQFWRDVREKY